VSGVRCAHRCMRSPVLLVRSTAITTDNGEMKKCRARFGLEAQTQWCKHCKRKKRCLWFREGPGGSSTGADTPEEHSPPAQVCHARTHACSNA
jgi:glutaredoxin